MANKNKNKLPEKRTMNLYTKGAKNKANSVKRIIIIVLAVIFVLVGVLGRYGMLLYKNHHLKESKAQLATYKEQLVNYKEIKTEYERYTKSYMTDEEKSLVDRTTLIVCANNCINDNGKIHSISITGNSATVNCSVDALHDVPTIVSKFESFNDIAYVDVASIGRTTSKDSNDNSSVISITATIKFGLGGQTGSEGVQ